MNAKRKKVTEKMLERIASIIPGDDTNVKIFREKLEAMNDDEFESYLRKLKPVKTQEDIANREWIPFYVPNLSGKRVSIARNYQIAKGMGRSLDHRLVMTDPSTGLQYVTPHAYPVLDLPVRRQAQTVAKKRSIPEHNQRIDDLTEQPTSESKGSRISSPEGVALLSRGLDNTMLEFVKIRGGDTAGYREYKRLLIETGEVSYAQLDGLGIAKSTKTASIIFNCMHIGNNLDPSTKVPADAMPDTL
jgi:hypothetical protein